MKIVASRSNANIRIHRPKTTSTAATAATTTATNKTEQRQSATKPDKLEPIERIKRWRKHTTTSATIAATSADAAVTTASRGSKTPSRNATRLPLGANQALPGQQQHEQRQLVHSQLKHANEPRRRPTATTVAPTIPGRQAAALR